MPQLTDKQMEFLDNPYVGVVTTLRKDGSPHATVVWVDREGGTVSFNTEEGRSKPAELENDSRVSLLVLDPSDPYTWVGIDGRARLTTDGADEQIDRLAKKYLDKDEYPWRNPEKARIKVVIEPEHIDTYGFDG